MLGLQLNIIFWLIFQLFVIVGYLLNMKRRKLVQKFNLCFLQPTVTSENVSSCPRPTDIQFTVMREKNDSHFLKLEINLNVDS